MTLKNKLDATDEVELAHEEERVSKLGALALYRDGTLETLVPGTFSALKAIHVALFGDIYDFAGRFRTTNLSKGNFLSLLSGQSRLCRKETLTRLSRSTSR